jgi:maleylacetate reductase
VTGMETAFTWSASASRVILAPGALARVPDEVSRLGGRRVLLIGSGTSTREALRRVRESLDAGIAAVIPVAAQHVPEAIAAAAVSTAHDSAADLIVTVGGGSATGLGKVVALECDLPLIAVPTTYSGSEMTPMWGRTSAGVKRTGMDARVLPRAVVYDPELCLGMPPMLAAASGMNALAHCAEALWSAGASPVTSVLAEEGIRRLLVGLPAVVASSGDLEGHAGNLVAACLAGLCIAQAGSGIHHRTCHVLGGGWNLPHAETHAVVLPHATALVAPRAPEAMVRLMRLLDTDDPAAALFDFERRLGLPASLRALGMPPEAVGDAARRIAELSHDDPLVPGPTAVRTMLDGAFEGSVPPPSE